MAEKKYQQHCTSVFDSPSEVRAIRCTRHSAHTGEHGATVKGRYVAWDDRSPYVRQHGKQVPSGTR